MMIVPIGEEETICICTSTPIGSIRDIEDLNIIKNVVAIAIAGSCCQFYEI
jgi:hypothetical protein